MSGPRAAVLLLLALSTRPFMPAPAAAQAPPPPPDAALAHARKLLRSTPLIDGHNDLPWEIRRAEGHPMDVAAYDLRTTAPKQTDLPRLKHLDSRLHGASGAAARGPSQRDRRAARPARTGRSVGKASGGGVAGSNQPTATASSPARGSA